MSAGGRAARFGRVAVLMGGDSAEREVSLMSGRAVLEALRRAGVDAHPIDKDAQVLERLRAGRFERVFLILHGRGGEDGTIQGALETIGLPYTGSGVLGSALAMDKVRAKQVWQSVGIPTPPFRVLASAADLEAALAALGLPLMIKPAREGSSLGASKVEAAAELPAAWERARALDREVIAEPWVIGPEYTATVLGEEVLPLIRLEPARTFYDYQAKYADGAGTRYHCPCGLEADREAELAALAREAFRALGASGWGRVDFLCDERGAPWFIDANTAPGMTSHSLVPMAARAAGIELEELVCRVLESSL